MRNIKISVVKFFLIGIAMLMLGSSYVMAQVNVSLPNITRSFGSADEFIDVTVSNVPANVFGYSFNVTYDKNVIYLTEASITGTISPSNNASFLANPDTANGKISVAYASPSAISSTSGILIKLKVKYRNNGNSPLAFNNSVLFNAGTPTSNETDGSVTIPNIAVSFNGPTVTVGDTVLIPVNVSALTAGNNILGFQFTATYNPLVLKVLDAVKTGSMSDLANSSILANPNNTTGSVNVAWASAGVPIVGGPGVLVYLRAVVLNTGTSTNTFSSFKFNAGSPAVGTVSGLLTAIAAVNNPPTINPVTPKTVKEGSLLSFQLSGTDPDLNSLSFSNSIVGFPSGANLTPAGAFTWTPGFNQAGSYSVKFYVSDGHGGSDSTIASITVTDSNRAPSLSLSGSSPYAVNEGDSLTITLTGADVDLAIDDTLTFSSSTVIGSAVVKTSSTTARFGWRPSFSQAGTYNVTFTVTDRSGASTTLAPIVINVANVNGPPSFAVVGANQLSTASIKEGQTFTFTYKAVDPEGDVVNYFKTDPSPATSTINMTTGVFTWTPPLGAAANSPYQIVILASDGVNTTASAIGTLIVTVNHAPTIVINPAGTTKTVAEQGSLSFNVTTLDSDSADVITLTNSTLPNGATFSGGIFAWSPAIGQQGTYSVKFVATDNSGAKDSVTVTINVTKTNLAPVFANELADTTVAVGTVITFDYNATDANSDSLTYSIAAPVPAGASINASTGVLTWTTQATATTVFTLNVIVTDGSMSDTATSVVTVTVPQSSISGVVTYNNTGATPLVNVIVTLSGAANAVDTTDASGAYSFTGLIPGNYTVTASKTTGWGGVNASDALLAQRFFLSLATLDSLQKLAADVNNSGAVNNTDALAIVNRYVGLSTSFTKPDWVFLPTSSSVNVTNTNVTINIKGQATGDVNASLVPLAKIVSSLGSSISGTLELQANQTFEVPVKLNGSVALGAASLQFTYPADILEFKGVNSNLKYVYKDNNGTVTLAWADMTGGKNAAKISYNDVLASLVFTAKKNGSAAINITAESELADENGNVYKGSVSLPSVNISSPTQFSLKQNYPNPFNPSTTIQYAVPEDGNISVTIYNVTGQEVTKLVNGFQNAGSYQVVWNASNLSSGIYFYKLNFESANRIYSDIKSMILLK